MYQTKSTTAALVITLVAVLFLQSDAIDASAPALVESFICYGDTIPAASYDGGPRAWEVVVSDHLNLRAEPSTQSEVLDKYSSGAILDNIDGCKLGDDGKVWCYVQKLGGGAVGYAAAEYLKPAVGPDGWAATGPDDSAIRAGQGDFDATGSISCQLGGQQEECTFGVARAGGGDATVVITYPDGSTRAIYFRMGMPIGADTSEADPGDFSATKEGDRHMIRIGDERYEIVDAVVLGG